MDVHVALVQLRQSALSDRSPTRTLNPADYDVLLLHDAVPSTSGLALPLDEPSALRPLDHSAMTVRPEGKRANHLPRLRVAADRDPSEEALKLVRRLAGSSARNRLWRRAVQVGLWKSEASSISSNQSNVFFSGSRHYGTLYCIPVLEKDKTIFTVTQRRGRFENLSKLLNLCQNSSEAIDPETRHLVIRLEEWLREKQRQKSRFLTNLFLRAAASSRVRLCAHNPAYDPDESRSCHGRVIGVTKHDVNDNRKSCELADEVRRGNDARAKMIFLEKYDVFIMNPLFGAGLCYHAKDVAPAYFAKGRPTLAHMHRHSMLSQQVSTSTGGTGNQENGSAGSAASWAEEYPLHRSAYLGQPDIIKQLLAQGHDPNKADADSWTPLHYAAWYNQLEAMQVLLNYGNCNVNLRNKSGSTALHFAAWYGNVYMVELLMSHPGILIEAKDKDGKTPRDLCECVPKPEFQAIALLLQASTEEKLAKVQVDMMDGSNAMLSLVNGIETTATQLHEQLCNELKLSEACGRLFAVWICSDSLELQLKAEHKPISHMQKWQTKILPKWSDSADAAKEKPRLVFRRDARATLGDEKQAGLLNDAAMTLLYEEARQNYLRGLYPCSDQDTTALAGIMMHILHGNYDAKKDKAHLANEKTLRMLLPEHRLRHLKSKEQTALITKIIQEHKLISSKGTKGITALQYQFLSFCWNLCVYGSAFFDALVFMTRPVKGDLHVHVGVNDYGLHLINSQTKTLFQTYPLKGLEWTHKADHPYLEIKAKQPGQLSIAHVITVKTRQASHINMLLTKLLASNNSRSSSKSNLRQS